MTDRPLLLDLYCGAGGAGVGYHRAGFDVVGVDINPQPNYPYEFYQSDAIEFLKANGHEFDAKHASPPCQHYSRLSRGTNARKRDSYPDLLDPTRQALDADGSPYVIENVVGAPIRHDLMLCGLNFGLKVFRHRLFEVAGWSVVTPAHPSHRGHRVQGYRHGKRYDGDMFPVYGDGGDKGTLKQWQDAMGIDWTNVKKGIAEAIPPAYTEYIGRQLIGQLS